MIICTKAVVKCDIMPRLLRPILSLVTVLSIQVYKGKAEFSPLSSHCLLVDADVYYNASPLGNINLHETNIAYQKSNFVTFMTQSWPKELEDNCRNVKIVFDYVDFKQQYQSVIILAATFLYEFEDGAETNPDDKKLMRCINATHAKYDVHVRRFNWLDSIPSLKGKRHGQKVKPHAAHYGRNIRHCCLEMSNTTCCPEGAMFVPGDERSSCECKQGHYYDHVTPFVCHRCPKGKYQPRSNMEHCQPCPEGMTALAEGSTSCTPIVECREEIIWTVEGSFIWYTTRAGNTSEHRCPHGPNNVTITRDCHWMSNITASWTKFDSSSCNPSKHTRTLLTLSQTPIDASNVNNVTELLLVETAATTELDSYDVALATTTIVDIVDYNSSRIEVAEHLIQVLDNILSVNADILAESQLLNQTTSRLINATERFAENLPLRNGSCLLVAPNIAIKSEAITRQSFNKTFTFVANSGPQNSTSIIQSQITITARSFQQAIQQGSSRVISIVYQNNKLFPVSDKQSSKKGHNRSRAKMGDAVLAGKFKNAAVELVERAIELKFPNNIKNGSGFLPRCVFWDFTANDGFGNWSAEGCSYSEIKLGYVTCHCNHMTNFAILLTADPDRDESDSNHKHVLSLISYIGCGVSLLAVILTLITYIFFRDLRRSNAQTILCHLCIALIGLLVSYFVVATRDPKTTDCLVSSLLVHYFLLATFAWMGVEGINMYLALVKVVSAHVPRFMPKAVVIAWGFPGLVVIVTGALACEDYSTEESCFLHGIAFYISVLTPAVLFLSLNFVMFGLTMYSLSRMGKEVSQENKIKGYRRVRVALAIMVLLGLTWFFGTVAIGSARLLFQYLFCIFNSLQGFAIFWFHCVRQPEVRQCWADLLRGRRGRQRKYTASTTAPALQVSNAVKKSSSSSEPPKLSPLNSRGKYSVEQKARTLDQNQNAAKSV